jgi:hypothetical protein
MRDNPDNRMKPFVYDPEKTDDTVPSWYTNLGGQKTHLM